MNIEDIRENCLNRKGVTESFPFGDQTLVFKVMGKMFLLIGLDGIPPFFNAKCDPEHAVELRAVHPAIRPGYHMNKEHWNSVYLDGSLSRSMLIDLIDRSYNLIVAGLKKAHRDALEQMK